MWAFVAFAAAAFSAQEVIFGYNVSTPTLGINKVTISYRDNGTVTLAERNARNGFYKVDLDRLKDYLEPSTPATFKSGPFSRVSYDASYPLVIAGTVLVESNGFKYFNSDPNWDAEKQYIILPDPKPLDDEPMTVTPFNNININVVSNALFTNFDGGPEYTKNIGGDCSGTYTFDDKKITPCMEVSPDDIFGKGNAFMTYYFYSSSGNIEIEALSTIMGSNFAFPEINPKQNVICAMGSQLQWYIQDALKKITPSTGSFCSPGTGLTRRPGVCSTFGENGNLAYKNGYKQLNAYVQQPSFKTTKKNLGLPVNFTCLPWSVIQDNNVEFVLGGLTYQGGGSSNNLKNAFLNATREAKIGCQNFAVYGQIADYMYCPVMWRPWQSWSLHSIVDPDKVLSYTNLTNGQKYFFWVAQCYNDGPQAQTLAVETMKQALINNCAPCQPGEFSNNETGDNCEFAPAGKYALSNHLGTVDCNGSAPHFQYAQGLGNTECLTCSGTNSANVSLQILVSVSDGLGIGCTTKFCLRGEFFNPTTERCQRCSNNTYTTDNISRICLPCSGNGTLLVKDNSGYAVGCQCIPGFGGLSGAQRNESGTKQCEPCLAGTYSDNKTDIKEICKTCVDSGSGGGSYPNQEHTTCVCRKGFFGPSGDGSSCEGCAVGKYTNATGQSICATCSAGTYQDKREEHICIECISGTYSNSPGSELCTKCQAGTATDPNFIPSDVVSFSFIYASDGGKTECRPCNRGTYQDQNGEEGCLECSVGTYADATGESLCQRCTVGTYNNANGQVNCTACNRGTYQDQNGEADGCLECSAGTYADATGESLCQRCEAGTYANGNGQVNCTACSKGTYIDTKGATLCGDCSLGTFSDSSGSSSCQRCSKGSYQDQEGSSVCAPCASGTYAEESGETECKECERGSFQEESGKSECKECPSGTYSTGTASSDASCISCDEGTYQDEPGATSLCKLCSLGTYSGQGFERCIVNRVNVRTIVDPANNNFRNPGFCERGKEGVASGKHAPYGGMSDCIKCHAGTYQTYDIKQAEVCVSCPVGTYQDEFGQLDCKVCPSNQRGLEEGQYFCKCAPGTYDVAKIDYPPQCSRCTGQEYQNEIGSRSGCKTCEDFYMPLPGHQECVPIYEEVTDTCLMIFWRRECYKDGIHPITIGLWLFVFIVTYQMGKCCYKEARHHILDTPKNKNKY